MNRGITKKVFRSVLKRRFFMFELVLTIMLKDMTLMFSSTFLKQILDKKSNRKGFHSSDFKNLKFEIIDNSSKRYSFEKNELFTNGASFAIFSGVARLFYVPIERMDLRLIV